MYTRDSILALKEHEFDFGKVKERSRITHEFTVQNKGTVPWKSRRSPLAEDALLRLLTGPSPPGGERKITLTVDTKGYQGHILKTVVVYANDPKMARFRLGVSAFVQVPVSVSPPYVILRGNADREISRSVKIVAGLEKPLVIELDKFSLEGKVRYEIAEIEKARFYFIRFSSIPGTLGNFWGFLNLKTNYEEKSLLNIRIRTRFTQGKTNQEK